jgi:hypothetical protein
LQLTSKYEVTENDVKFSIDAVEKIKELKPIIEMQNKIINKNSRLVR